MTPERKAYWEKCSLKERTLRALINDEKCAIKVLKNNFKYPENYNFNVLLIMISQCKVRLSAYRHELARVKGMYRQGDTWGKRRQKRALVIITSTVCRCAECNKVLCNSDKFCSRCGLLLVWRKRKYG